MTVVIIGAGLLGTHLHQEFCAAAITATLVPRANCDVTSPSDVGWWLKDWAPDVVINCAAYTNVDGAETHDFDAFNVNAFGAHVVATQCRRYHAKLVHISTDFVFDGETMMEPDSPMNPLSVYGQSKMHGEKMVREALGVGDDYQVVRLQHLYGTGGHNFISRLPSLMKSDCIAKLDGERIIQPTSARAAARQIVRLVAAGEWRTLNVACTGSATWADFGRVVAMRLGCPVPAAVATATFGLPARRPRASRFVGRGMEGMPSWEVALEEWLTEIT